MKGLLIKDWKLLTRQKTTLLIMLLLLFLFPVLEMDVGFVVSYTMIIILFQTVSTVSYDDFDNGMAFLFALPIGRKTYVREKYVLGLMAAVFGWILSVVINVVFMLVMSNEDAGTIGRVVLSLVLIFPVMLLMWEILLPMQLKFGAEKARVVMFIVVGVGAAAMVIGEKVITAQQAEKLSYMMAGVTPSQAAIALFALALAGLLIYYTSSVRIMEKKEY